jgi:hypothetical protein
MTAPATGLLMASAVAAQTAHIAKHDLGYEIGPRGRLCNVAHVEVLHPRMDVMELKSPL